MAQRSPHDVVLSLVDAVPPPTLYHYTKRPGLIGMVEGKTLWASHIRYLNDSREFNYATGIAQEVLQRLGERAGKVLGSIPHDLARQAQETSRSLDLYVFSLSGCDDSLSQWRAYGSPPGGYEVCFDTTNLVQHGRFDGFHLSRCEYDPKKQEHFITTIVDEAVQEYGDEIAAGRHHDDGAAAAQTFFLLAFVQLAPILKHPSFYQEEEWRLISSLSIDAKVAFRDGGALLVPYRTIGIRRDGVADPITEVVVGPTAHANLEEEAVSKLLMQVASTASVRHSAIPFRPG